MFVCATLSCDSHRQQQQSAMFVDCIMARSHQILMIIGKGGTQGGTGGHEFFMSGICKTIFLSRIGLAPTLRGTGRDSIVQEVARNVKNINKNRSSPGETKQKLGK